MKKLLALGLAAAVSVAGLGALAGCGEGDGEVSFDPVPVEELKVGFIALHDSNSTYDKNFLDAIEQACENKGISEENLLIRTGIPEDNTCLETALDLADQGCDVIFADSFGHESFMMEAAEEYPSVRFCHATGTHAHTSDLANFHNAFASIYEGRYLAGVAAGMKLVEMYNDYKAGGDALDDVNFDTEGNIKIGYVGAYPYAEVVSGYTSFFLGAQSVVEEELAADEISISMEVSYTSSWYDLQAENDTARSLISRGAALISQHADSMGAPNACEEAGVPNVSYNGSTAASCPDTYIVSSRINWVPYFEYMLDCVINGEQIDKDWTGTLDTGSVVLTEFGTAAAEGTAEKVAEVQAQLEAGTLHVFDCSKFTVDGEHLTTYTADVDDDGTYTGDTEAIENGIFYESRHRSAPYFDVRIDGITELASDS